MSDNTTDRSPREHFQHWGEYARSLTDLNWDGQAQSEREGTTEPFYTADHELADRLQRTQVPEFSV